MTAPPRSPDRSTEAQSPDRGVTCRPDPTIRESSEELGRGTPSKRSLTWLIVLAITVGVAAWVAEVDPVTLVSTDARQQMWQFVTDGVPPDFSAEYLLGRTVRDGLLWAIVETIAISIAGIVLAVGLAIPLAVAGASNVTHTGPMYTGTSGFRRYAGHLLQRLTRGILSFLRAVPDLVWGFLFVTAVGLGPFAGVLALGIHNAGVLGKIYADFLEDTDPAPAEAVYATGATRLQTVFHGIVPQLTPTLVSYTLYRWECAIRAATILGFVGAGGIGYYLTVTITRLQYQKLVTAIIAVFVLVVAADYISARLRRKLV